MLSGLITLRHEQPRVIRNRNTFSIHFLQYRNCSSTFGDALSVVAMIQLASLHNQCKFPIPCLLCLQMRWRCAVSNAYGIPYTGNTSSPRGTPGNALILVPIPRYELGAPCPKFSGLQEVPAYRRDNPDFHSIILIYMLRKLGMLSPTSSSLTNMNLAY